MIPFVTCLYGSYEAAHIVRPDVTIQTNKLPGNTNSIKIAHISDVHLGLLTGTKKLKKIIQKIEEIDPDLLVCTGDLLDGQGDGIDQLAALLGEVSPRLGKYAILGNHEFYTGIDKSKKFLGDAGFIILDGKAVSAGGVITLAGVNDRISRGTGTWGPPIRVLAPPEIPVFTLVAAEKN